MNPLDWPPSLAHLTSLLVSFRDPLPAKLLAFKSLSLGLLGLLTKKPVLPISCIKFSLL